MHTLDQSDYPPISETSQQQETADVIAQTQREASLEKMFDAKQLAGFLYRNVESTYDDSTA